MSAPHVPDGLCRLLRPRSVAVVGASADPAKTSGRPIGYLRAHGYGGSIYPVNPKAGRIDGLPCYLQMQMGGNLRWGYSPIR